MGCEVAIPIYLHICLEEVFIFLAKFLGCSVANTGDFFSLMKQKKEIRNFVFNRYIFVCLKMQGDQKVSVHLMITIQEVTSNVQSVPHQSPDIY
jgi:hypothetical protein